MQYFFKTPFGKLFISSAPYGGYYLKIEEEVVNWSEKAEELAFQVYEKTSGFEEWDKAGIEAPKTLEDWNVKI